MTEHPNAPTADASACFQVTGGHHVRLATQAEWLAALAQGEHACVDLASRGSGPFAVGMSAANGRRVFLAVDRFAIQTLCYTVRDGCLVFGERADEVAGEDTDLDPQSLFDYLFFHCIPAPRTVFQGVLRVPPGHYVWFDGDRPKVAPYWTPRFESDPRPPRFDALKAEFRDLLQASVLRHLSGGTPACFLSGGTDSSTVAGMIGKVARQPAHTYSIGFEAEGYDEMGFARIAARHFGCVHREYYVTPADLVRSIPEVARHYDQPFGNSSALPAYYCARVAQQDGVAHMLAGDGGDELFGGNSRYAKQRIFDAYRLLPTVLRSGLIEPLTLRTRLGGLPGLSKAKSYVEQARVPMPDRLQIYNLLLRTDVHEVLTPDFLARVNQDAPAQLQRDVWGASHASDDVNRALAFDWRFTLADCDLPKVRETTRLAGVSVGFPLLDDELVAFSTRLPTDYKLKGLQLRWFFKEALRGFLPDEVITKKKQGFGLPFGVWLTRDAALKALATDTLHRLSARNIVRPGFVDGLLSRLLPAHPGYYGEMVWILMMMEQWLESARPGYRLVR